ncbi:MAG TPA: hypothetical protein VM509_07435, partial [Planctomycetota bacterium]|nr:hypothetical protein [Planctomycetota bacterium]
MLVLAGASWCLWLALFQSTRRIRGWLLWILAFVWMTGLFAVLVDSGDWVHLFWAAQVPPMCVFLLSGALLLTVWPEDAASRGEMGTTPAERWLQRLNPAWWFLAVVASFGFLPMLLLEILFPPDGRNIGEPIRRVVELALWGLGGALPECLELITTEGRSRGVGFLPREVTVSTSSLAIAAYLWIGFCTLALIGRCILWPRVRRAFLVLSPGVVGGVLIVVARTVTAPIAWFDAELFFGSVHSGVWRSDPAVLKS